MQDLWPGDLVSAPLISKPPVIILKEQAALLGKKTNNLVEAEVAQIKPGSVDENTWFYNFLIVAPTLDYKYKFFTIKHYLYGYYPIFIDIGKETYTEIDPKYQGYCEYMLLAQSEEEFIDQLREIFATASTKKIIGTLLAMSQEEARAIGKLKIED